MRASNEKPFEPFAFSSFNPLQQSFDYWIDAWQRQILFFDILRQRGNVYFEQKARTAPQRPAFRDTGSDRRTRSAATGQLHAAAHPAAARRNDGHSKKTLRHF